MYHNRRAGRPDPNKRAVRNEPTTPCIFNKTGEIRTHATPKKNPAEPKPRPGVRRHPSQTPVTAPPKNRNAFAANALPPNPPHASP